MYSTEKMSKMQKKEAKEKMTAEQKAAARQALKEAQQKAREEAQAKLAEEKTRLRELREQERLKVGIWIHNYLVYC